MATTEKWWTSKFNYKDNDINSFHILLLFFSYFGINKITSAFRLGYTISHNLDTAKAYNLYLFTEIFSSLFFLAVLLILMFKYELELFSRPLKLLETTDLNWGNWICNFIYWVVFMMAVSKVGGLFLQTFPPVSGGDTLNSQILNDTFKYTPVILQGLLTVLIAPIIEEIVFRGLFLFSKENTNWKRLITLLIFSSLLFGFSHAVTDIQSGLYYSFMGLCFGFITYYTNSLYPAITLHIINNAVAYYNTLN